MNIYDQAVAESSRLRKLIESNDKAHNVAQHKLWDELDDNLSIIWAAENGVDASKFLIARSIIAVKWYGHKRTAEVVQAFNEAMEDVRNGCVKLQKEYFGVKSYDRWDSQGHNSSYGMGPTHGSIWFSIGLTEHSRSYGHPLSSDEKIAVNHYLAKVMETPEILEATQ